MKRTLLALALWLCASAAQAQWTTIAGDACLVLTAGSCFHAVTTSTATATLDVSSCSNITMYAHESVAPVSVFTVVPQGCFVDADAGTSCVDLASTALDGDSAFYYVHQGPPPRLLRGNPTVATCAAGDCKLEVACAR